jgi:hypothetical protein
MKKLTSIFFLIVMVLVTMGQSDCDDGPPPPPATGFSIHTQNNIDTFIGRQTYDFGNVDTAGNVINDIGTAYGSVTNFRHNTDANGRYTVNDGRVPARWHFAEFSGPCTNKTLNDDVTAHKEQFLICILPDYPPFFNMTPSSVDLNSPPASFTIGGAGLSTTYGMPVVEYYDEFGQLMAQTTATAVAGDGTWLQANTPNLYNVYSGTYIIAIRNATSQGLWEFVGTTSIDAWGRDRPLCDPYGTQEQSCWNSGGDWDSSACQCINNPCGSYGDGGVQPVCYENVY